MLDLERGLWRTQHYICPREGSPGCGSEEDYFCASWGCETLALWKTVDPTLQLTRVVRPGAPTANCTIGNCNPIIIQPLNWRADYREGGNTWGIWLYVSSWDPGALFSVQRRTLPRAPNPVGPLSPILQPKPLRPPKVTQAPVVTITPGWNDTETPKPVPGPTEAPGELRLLPETSHRGLLGTLEAMFRFLNKTSPNITKDCWLCLNPEPPYNVGIGANISFGQNVSEIRNYSVQSLLEGLCIWGHQSRLTLEDLQGTGTCIVPVNYPLGSSPYSSSCTQVTELPQEYDECLMGLGLAGSTAVGTAALITGHQNYKELGQQVDQDLSTLEKSVGQLEDSLSSLAEVVLQNWRGLDLLFLKQGGLCLALGEACCFYTNHSGVIRESLSQLRKRLLDREERRRAEGNWYENLFT
ncbi:hypothetical protein QTO34_000571 [Cnephaeus nilssonii]|uniref:Envelope protein n=1 Tax=Cnephaeus nilssonii TaxID=3371016 RepID=A0AA40LUH5_CNENI|nr:hypothetical protein QTO34_000571 [Eptesicus nilssonii]